MGLLSTLLKPAPARLVRLPSGSFTLDRDGQVVTSTLPLSFPATHLEEIGRQVLDYFRGAQLAQIPIRDLVVNYPALKLTARELRGGAIVFLTPQALTKN